MKYKLTITVVCSDKTQGSIRAQRIALNLDGRGKDPKDNYTENTIETFGTGVWEQIEDEKS